MKSILIIGATSAIATACARIWATTPALLTEGGAHFFLVARDSRKLEATAQDLRARGAQVNCWEMDACDTPAHTQMVEAAVRALGQLDIVLLAHGTLPDQSRCEVDVNVALEAFANNATSVIALLTALAVRLEAQQRGTLAVITSVAGDRGRPSNYVYGSSKAAVSTFCEGLRARLFARGVAVVDIRPGFVNTPMTAHLKLPGLLLSSPQRVAHGIVKAIARKDDVAYVPGYWRWILLAVRWVPGPIYKRLKL
jgi:hypothetical protein